MKYALFLNANQNYKWKITIEFILLYFSIFIPSKISVLVVGVCAMAMQILATYWIQRCRRNCFADANIILVDPNVRLVAKDLNKRNGDSPQHLKNSHANVRIIFFNLFYIICSKIFFVFLLYKSLILYFSKTFIILFFQNSRSYFNNILSFIKFYIFYIWRILISKFYFLEIFYFIFLK